METSDPKRLATFVRNLENPPSSAIRTRNRAADEVKLASKAIYETLRNQTGHDFSGYKKMTFLRRVRHRMVLLEITTLGIYLDRLRSDAGEVQALFYDLLINVTTFFRDAAAFALLERNVIPKLFADRGAADVVRVWVPGCSTGEEVYSIAILLREQMARIGMPPRVQIYATDIDTAALEVARAGRYPIAVSDGISPERQTRFFYKDGDSLVVKEEVRKLCLFSTHSIIRDPPFRRMDLVSCRNLLIYLDAETQNRVIPTLHFSLVPKGYLLLGAVENVGAHNELFAIVDESAQIYQARVKLPVKEGTPVAAGKTRRALTRAITDVTPLLRQKVEAHLIDRFSPVHAIVNGDGDVVYCSARTDPYLNVPEGAATGQLLAMVRPALRRVLGALLNEVGKTNVRVVHRNVMVDDEDDTATLTVEPFADSQTHAPLFLVLFERFIDRNARGGSGVEPLTAVGLDEVERDMRDTRQLLRATVDKYLAALGQLGPFAEEMISSSPQAQFSSEELEATKEEVQSLNEELHTIDAELTSKVDALDNANSDLKNLFESTNIATIFLDRKLVIRNFTPAATEFFNLCKTDIGRPLQDLAGTLNYSELKEHIALVLDNGEMVEYQLPPNGEDRHFLVRLLPYLDGEAQTKGVVVTMVDVTTLARAEEHQQTLISELNHRVKNMLAIVISIANHTLATTVSPEAFTTALLGRLHAMSRTYGLLARANWRDVLVRDVLRVEMDAFGLDRFTFTGPDVHLTPQQGLSLGMVIHELAANACKYGALSLPQGGVSIIWTMSSASKIHLVWNEKGGPEVVVASTEGFGLSLVRGEIAYRLGGHVDLDFQSRGLDVQIEFELDQ